MKAATNGGEAKENAKNKTYPFMTERDLIRFYQILPRIYSYFQSIPMLTTRHNLENVAKVAVETKWDEDFFWSLEFSPRFYADLFYNGFLPIAYRLEPFPTADLREALLRALPSLAKHVARAGSKGLCILMPKLHKKRCLVKDWKSIHIGKNFRKRSKKYTISFDTELDKVMDGCVKQHGENWLYPPVRETFRSIHKNPVKTVGKAKLPIRIHSVELWDGEDLVAGELGYSLGRVYTSLTGYYVKDSTGTIQMLAMAGILKESGFELWDLGMSLPYKAKLGSKTYPRGDFVETLKSLRDKVPKPLPNSASWSLNDIRVLPTKSVNARIAVDCLRGKDTLPSSSGKSKASSKHNSKDMKNSKIDKKEKKESTSAPNGRNQHHKTKKKSLSISSSTKNSKTSDVNCKDHTTVKDKNSSTHCDGSCPVKNLAKTAKANGGKEKKRRLHDPE